MIGMLLDEAFLHQPLTGLEPNDGVDWELIFKDEVGWGWGSFEDAFHGVRRSGGLSCRRGHHSSGQGCRPSWLPPFVRRRRCCSVWHGRSCWPSSLLSKIAECSGGDGQRTKLGGMMGFRWLAVGSSSMGGVYSCC